MQLRQYQQDALDFIKTKHAALLNMGMGTGKTATAITHIERRGIDRVLIIAPKAVVPVWGSEFAKWGQQDWDTLQLDTGSIDKRTKLLATAVAEQGNRPLAVILNYDVLPYKIGQVLKGIKWGALVMDEQHRIKAPGGKQSRLCSQLSDRVETRLGLTGTPMPHSPLDIYAQFRALDKRIYGTNFTAFRARYAMMGGFEGKQVVGYQNLDELRERMALITYTCRTEDVLDLPPVTDVNRYCDLPPSTVKAYKELKSEMITQIEAGEITASNGLVKLLRLAQIASGFVTDDTGIEREVHSEKQALFADVLTELAPDWGEATEPVVVFSRFHHDLDAVRATAEGAGYTVGELSGRRDDMAQWNDAACNLMVVQVQSGSVGIDLTRARYCVYYTHDWSLGNYDQSRARVHRHGQERPVTYVHLVARGTVDELVMRALESKRNVVETVLREL